MERVIVINNTKRIFVVTCLSFVVFFVSVNAFATYHDARKVTLFINGYEDIHDDDIEGLKVSSITVGVWSEMNHSYQTTDSYILMKSISKEVMYSTSNWHDLTAYLNQR